MLRIGLTGGIGSGKTTVSNKFQNMFNIPVIDADEINRDLLTCKSSAYAEIVAAFGHSILTNNGAIDRRMLRQQIFSDPESRRKLEMILHPRIRAEISYQISTLTCPYVLVVVPLLVELNMQDQFDRILVISADAKHQVTRVSKRDACTQEDATKIIASQIEPEQRIQYADDIIDNNGDLTRLDQQIQHLHEKYMVLST